MRATVDLDDPSEFDVLRVWNRLGRYGDGHVFGRVSSSGEGVHLKVHGCDADLVPQIRRECCDDAVRRQFDSETALKPKQILFASKPTGEAGEWTDDVEDVLADYRRRAPVSTRYPDAPAFR